MRWLAGERVELSIRDARTDAFAGHIQLGSIIPPLNQAMTGYSLLPRFRGRGFVTRATVLLVDWAFEHTPLCRIIAGTDTGNVASHRVLERAGFARDALLYGLLPGPGGTRLDDLQWYRLRTPLPAPGSADAEPGPELRELARRSSRYYQGMISG
ncbi:Acetyltransferase (GNAT) domain-containing protein [Streptosporangium subroseum]|uniref:Acetyltransferase (GNAT) domain-containing protein n=1 Tax=Streptosporangium subroseum TaxID=106412 RepID=A0A239NRM5_9ACTN|nr:Acetyltransferase (GNAT) domain-containing protein [Streptosporangium subroseum]